MQERHLLIMAGGTGGHIFPGLAVAQTMQQAGWRVSWLGANNGLEVKLLTDKNIELHTLPIQGLRGKGSLGLLTAPFRLAFALYRAWCLIRQLRPDVVIGFGGYASGPGGIAAWLLRIPLIIHEQNAIAGMTNRILAKLATTVLQAFPHSFVGLKQVLTVGNPIRQELTCLPVPQQRLATRSAPWKLLVLGGSRGALAINQTVVEGVSLLPADQRPEIWHQAGANHVAITKQNYVARKVMARVEPFIDNMAEAYAWADIVICRAGALTISELAAVGVGSILVPYPYAVDDHQAANAKFLEAVKAAVVMTQNEFTPTQFVKVYSAIHKSQLLSMAGAAYNKRETQAVALIKQICEKIAKRGSQ